MTAAVTFPRAHVLRPGGVTQVCCTRAVHPMVPLLRSPVLPVDVSKTRRNEATCYTYSYPVRGTRGRRNEAFSVSFLLSSARPPCIESQTRSTKGDCAASKYRASRENCNTLQRKDATHIPRMVHDSRGFLLCMHV